MENFELWNNVRQAEQIAQIYYLRFTATPAAVALFSISATTLIYLFLLLLMPFYSAYITYSSSLIFIYKVTDFSIFLPWMCEKNLKYPIYQL